VPWPRCTDVTVANSPVDRLVELELRDSTTVGVPELEMPGALIGPPFTAVNVAPPSM
jgi:hypothetical protein